MLQTWSIQVFFSIDAPLVAAKWLNRERLFSPALANVTDEPFVRPEPEQMDQLGAHCFLTLTTQGKVIALSS